MNCFIPKCKHYNLTHTCSFFKFPKDEFLQKAWIQIMCCGEPLEQSRICSCHFVGGDKKLFPTILEVNKDYKLKSYIKNDVGVFTNETLNRNQEIKEEHLDHRKVSEKQDIAKVTAITNIKIESTEIEHTEVGYNFKSHTIQKGKGILSSKSSNFNNKKKKVTFNDLVMVKDEILEDFKTVAKKKSIIKDHTFGASQLVNDDERVLLYTGFPNSDAFKEFLQSVNGLVEILDINNISEDDQVLITLMHLNSNYSINFLARKYACSKNIIEYIISSWGTIIEDALQLRRQSKKQMKNKLTAIKQLGQKLSPVIKLEKESDIESYEENDLSVRDGYKILNSELISDYDGQQNTISLIHNVNSLITKNNTTIVKPLDPTEIWAKADQIMKDSETYFQNTGMNRNKKKERLSLQKLLNTNNPDKIENFTGFKSKEDLIAFVELVRDTEINYQYRWKVEFISREDQILMTLIFLKTDFKLSVLQDLFKCAQSTVSNILATWKPIIQNNLPFALHKEVDVKKRRTRKSTEDDLCDLVESNDLRSNGNEINLAINNLTTEMLENEPNELNNFDTTSIWERVEKVIKEAEKDLFSNVSIKEQSAFRMENIFGDDSLVETYTGFKTTKDLKMFLKAISEQTIMFDLPLRGRLSRDDQILMTLMNLRMSAHNTDDFAKAFKCGKDTVEKIIETWKPYLQTQIKSSLTTDISEICDDREQKLMNKGIETVNGSTSFILDEVTGDFFTIITKNTNELITDENTENDKMDIDITENCNRKTTESLFSLENKSEICESETDGNIENTTKPIIKRGKRRKVKEKFTLNQIIDDNEMIQFYTGFRSGGELKIFINSIKDKGATHDAVILKLLSIEDQILLTLMKLVRNATHLFLSTKFKCSLSIVRKSLAKWGPVIFQRLKTLNRIQTSVLTTISKEDKVSCNPVEKIMESDKSVLHYTGFETKKALKEYLQCFENLEIVYHHKWKVNVLNREEQILLALARKTRNYTNIELSQKFNCSIGTVRNIILSWCPIIEETFPSPFVVENQKSIENEKIKPLINKNVVINKQTEPYSVVSELDDDKQIIIFYNEGTNEPKIKQISGKVINSNCSSEVVSLNQEFVKYNEINIVDEVNYEEVSKIEILNHEAEPEEIKYVTEVPSNYEEIEVEEVSLYSPIEDKKKQNSDAMKLKLHPKTGDTIADIWARADSILQEAEKTLLATPIRRLRKYTDRFGLDEIIENDELVTDYTGFRNSEKLKAFIQSMEDYEVSYHHKWKVEALSHKDQIMMTLLNLKQNLNHTALCSKFKCSKSTVRNVISTWRRIFHEVSYKNENWDVICPLPLLPEGSQRKSVSKFKSKRKLEQNIDEAEGKKLKKQVKWGKHSVKTFVNITD